MSEEKIRSCKIGSNETGSSDSIPSFLLKTYQILQNSKYSDVICWTKNGEGFVVKRVKDFAQNILPTHFRHSNYTSFVRQLNMYDFHKMRQQNQENAFKNAMFKRGQKHLLKDIERKDYKKKKQKTQINVEKTGAVIAEVEARNDKKMEAEKQFYYKSLELFEKMLEESETRQGKLAEINSIEETDQDISEILEAIVKVKNTNNSLLLTAVQINKDWENMIDSKMKTIRQYSPFNNMDEEKHKENNGPTFHTFTNLGKEEQEQ